jgi:hypothetical protein
VLTLEVYYRYENAFGAAQNKKMAKKVASKAKGASDAAQAGASEPENK